MSTAVSCRDLWKSYRPRRAIGLKSLLLGPRTVPDDTRFSRQWALAGINLSVAKGQSFGVLGNNGSGKTTLLSVLLGTPPAERGQVEVQGRVASLLELGAGFHGELSGRDNIALYASMLGMTLREVGERFDAIVEFSELGSAIDSPLRTYSAGMIVRLAFSVVIHSPADVFLIDEVLAVGDARFQDKCRHHLREFKRRNGTLVIVSHNMAELESVCDEGICLDLGHVVNGGPIKGVIADYRMRSAAPPAPETAPKP